MNDNSRIDDYKNYNRYITCHLISSVYFINNNAHEYSKCNNCQITPVLLKYGIERKYGSGGKDYEKPQHKKRQYLPFSRISGEIKSYGCIYAQNKSGENYMCIPKGFINNHFMDWCKGVGDKEHGKMFDQYRELCTELSP